MLNRYFFVGFSLLFVCHTYGQTSLPPGIEITYKSWLKVIIDEDTDPLAKSVLEDLNANPTYDQSKAVYRDQKSLYESVGKIENPNQRFDSFSSGTGFRYYVFFDHLRNISRSTKELRRVALIKDSIPAFRWSIEGKKKDILGYACISAITMDVCLYRATDTVRVYFSPELPFNVGPEYLNGLPGAILYAETIGENGKRYTLAQELKVSEDIPVPKDPDNRGHKMEASLKDVCEYQNRGIDAKRKRFNVRQE